jgi:hypothetical protein
MSSKTVYAFSLSTSLMERVRSLMLDDSSRSQAQAPRPDEKGLLPENYAALQALTNSKAEGDALLNQALTHQTLGALARRTFAQAQRRNRKAYARVPTTSVSSFVETLLNEAVNIRTQTKKVATTNVSVKSAGRKNGNARKVA